MQRVTGEPASSGSDDMGAKRPPSEFHLRIYSALFLIALALFLTLASLETFAALITLFISAMAWEWGRLVRNEGLDAASCLQIAATVLAIGATAAGYPSWALLLVFGGTVGVLLMRNAAGGERRDGWWSAAGVFYVALPAVALVWIRSDAAYGWLAILYLFIVVWTTDSAAYVFGRWIGGAKLAPRISPKKTWSGLIGGAASAGLAGLVFAVIAGREFSLWLGGLAILLALISQIGDLGESAVKRSFGTKDTSSLIPGHGGVLDRVDGLLFAAVAAALLAYSIDPANPGRAIMLWP